MDSAAVLAAFRSLALAQGALTALAGQRVYISRADAVGPPPAVVLSLDGGEGRVSPRHHRLDIRAEFYSDESWAQAFAMQAALAAAADPQDPVQAIQHLPAPILRVTASAPRQAPGGDYYRVQQVYTVLAKEE